MALSYARPEVICGTILAAAGLGLTLGTNLFTGPPKPHINGGPIPRNAVFIFGVQSFEPRPYFGNGQDYRQFRTNLYVRQAQDQFETGQTLAREAWQALQRNASVTAGTYTGFFGLLMAESDPQYFGLDDTDNHRWTMTARLMYKG